MTVLLALPQAALADALAAALRTHGYDTIVARSPEESVRLAEQAALSLVITDALMPPVAGRPLIDWIRDQPRQAAVPCLLVNDYPAENRDGARYQASVPRPVEFALFLEQVARLVGPPARETGPQTHLALGPLRLSYQTLEVLGPAGAVLLTPTEFRLLTALARSRGAPVPPAALLEELWSGQALGGLDLLRVHISNLRKKLAEAAGEDLGLIRTAPRLGYALLEE